MGTNVEAGSREARAELFDAYLNNRSVENRNRIVSEYIYLAEIISRKFVNRGIEYDDIYQVASLALIKAAERYDPERGVKFASFATPTIIGEIKRYFRDKGSIIKIPRGIYEIYQKVNEARESLTQSLQRAPKVEEIAAETGIGEEIILENMESWNAYNMQSFDQMAYEGDDVELHETIGGEDAEFEKIENRDFLTRSLSKFSDAEKVFIKMRYTAGMTQKEIAAKLGVSQMYVSRLEKKILAKYKSSL